jgi:twinkle protein
VVFPDKDANESLLNGRTAEDMLLCIALAKEYPPALLSNPEEFADKVVDMFKNPEKYNGRPTMFEKLTYLLKGWRTGELTIWTGVEASGKSTLLNQHWIDCIRKGQTVCVASLEMQPHRYLRWAMFQYYGRSSVSEEEVRKALHWMTSKLFILNTVQDLHVDELFNIFEFAARRYGVNEFIVDSLMKLSFPGKQGENAEVTEFIKKLSNFAKKHDAHVHLVAHPRKGSSDNDVKGRVDVMGTSNIVKLADNCIITQRNEAKKMDSEPDCILHVKKNREDGTCGVVKLNFNQTTKLFTEY